MIGGGFLVLPYAMSYELAVLAPAAAMYVLGNKRGPVDWGLAIISALVFVAWWNAAAWAATSFTLAVCGTVLTLKRIAPSKHSHATSKASLEASIRTK
jgi:hypothetical protein